jgi:hypothetical protein
MVDQGDKLVDTLSHRVCEEGCMTRRRQNDLLPMQVLAVGGGGALAGIAYLITGPAWLGVLVLAVCLPIVVWAWRRVSR